MFSKKLKELIEKKEAIITDLSVKKKKNSVARQSEETRRKKELIAWYNSEFIRDFMTE
jgi:hypothetical protein|tara:strand:+ start:1266 stop:1439 length:174 start_codon:yes stop_codon:yes gene_type:complete